MGVFASLARLVERRIIVRRNPIIPTLPLCDQFLRIGGGLKPSDVSAIIREADVGVLYRMVDLANEARQKDSHLQSLLGTRETALATLRWKVTAATAPGDNAASDRDKEIAFFIQKTLEGAQGRGSDIRGFNDLIAHLTGGIYFGYAVSEVEYVKSGGNIELDGFRLISPRRFQFSRENGRLEWTDVLGMDERGVDLQKRYPGKFIQHQPRITGDVPAREGLKYVLMWAALFRNWNMTDWLRLAEMSWKPWRIGTYKSGASTEDIDDLTDALEQMTSTGIATMSDRVDLKVEWPERGRGAQSQHGELAEFLGMEMSKAVLGQTLTVDAGERGARSLGEVHDRVRRDIREGDAISLATTIRRDVIMPLVELNFGKDVMVPGFHFVTEDVEDIGTFSRAVNALWQSGVTLSQPWIRDRIGAPEPEPGEETIGPENDAANEDPEPSPEEAEDSGEEQDGDQEEEAA